MDKEYYKSCEENGEYCRFHQNIMSFTRHLRTKYWFPDYHSDFYNYEAETILAFQSLSTIILKILNDNISNLLSSDESTIANVENFLQKLKTFDYEDYFNSTLGSRRKKRSESDRLIVINYIIL